MEERAFQSIVVKPGQDVAEAPIPLDAREVRAIDSMAAPPASDAGVDEIDRALRSICGAVESILAEIRCVDAALGNFRAERQRRLPGRPPLGLADRGLNSVAITRREHAVPDHLTVGKSNGEISDELGISE